MFRFKIRRLGRKEVGNIKDLVSLYEFNDYRAYRMLNRKILREYLFGKVSDGLRYKNNYVFVAEDKTKIIGLVTLELLPWDTKHFGIKMAKIGYLMAEGDYTQASAIKNQLLYYLFQLCKKEKIVHLSSRINIDDISSIHTLERKGFKIMDTLVTYAFMNNRHIVPQVKELYEIRKFKRKDLPYLINIATKAFLKDRFHLDSFIPSNKSSSLYGKWIENSCNGKKDTVFVLIKKDLPVGFLTYKLDRELAKITGFKIMGQGLMAVSPEAKGGLISLVKATFRDVELHYDCVEYDTRLNNYEVIKICQRFGLDLIRAKYTFHKWLER